VLIIKAVSAIFKTLVLLGLLTSISQANAALPPMVVKALKDAKVPQDGVSVLVQEVGARRALLAVNPSASRNPGSVIKLVTTYAALELLGPAYRW
jgi:D-alanyl-D-alanine carboxypeptidase/D-alanyl-D-alanine-endopeptidase (penicillin-binding protein 4)